MYNPIVIQHLLTLCHPLYLYSCLAEFIFSRESRDSPSLKSYFDTRAGKTGEDNPTYNRSQSTPEQLAPPTRTKQQSSPLATTSSIASNSTTEVVGEFPELGNLVGGGGACIQVLPYLGHGMLKGAFASPPPEILFT